MNEQFQKLKKRIRVETTVKCALSSAAAAVLAVNAVLLPCLLNGVRLLWAWYLLIALGGAVSGGSVAFFCFRTDDKKIAARIDGELRLNERVQTALAYQSEEGEMHDLQRADTASALAGVQKLSFRNLGLTIVLAVVLALGVCTLPIVAVYADAGGDTGVTEPVDPPREVTDWEWQALDELIEYVKASEKADTVAKTGIVSELEGLRSVLVSGVSESSLPVFVQNTVNGVRNAVRSANEEQGITEEQKTGNSEEGEYVVGRLYEIFSLQKPSEGGDPSAPPEKPDDSQGGSDGNNTGTGELLIDGVPFFDPEKGYVSSGDPEVREKYYGMIQNAMLEGTISREEWENIVATYFADLRANEEEESIEVKNG